MTAVPAWPIAAPTSPHGSGRGPSNAQSRTSALAL